MKTVHEVSRLTGVSIRALQYYDRIGLLRPSARTAAGYRLYGDEDIAKLRQILLYRELEFPLKEIRELLSLPQAEQKSHLSGQIRRLAGEEPQYRLAISLHAATDSIRDQIMPINRKYPLKELLAACEAYQRAKGRMISFEYILIDRLNDTPEQCDLLAGIARRFHAHVNLIPFNDVDGCDFRRPPQTVIQGFFNHLQQRGVSVTLRQKKGGDINAACGQLRLRKMEKN